MTVPLRVELLTRPGCSLCDKVRILLDALGRELPLAVSEVDIDGDAGLRARYDQRIPVVRAEGVDVCEGRIGLPDLRAALRAQTGVRSSVNAEAAGA